MSQKKLAAPAPNQIVLAATTTLPVTQPVVTHVPVPEEVRGMYWTALTAGGKRGDELLAYMLERKLNTVVIDLNMDDGELGFTPLDPTLLPYAQTQPAMKDLEHVLAHLAEKHIYRIARIVVMRNSAFATHHPEVALRRSGGGLWHDKTGALWLDPAAPQVAAYTLALGREAFARGFDEVQFDYVRFPSDGSLGSIVYPVFAAPKTKPEIMKAFFKEVGGGLQKNGISVSFDVFGMTFWSNADYGVGQRLNDAFPSADYISPMVYPSHYYSGFQGFANPALFPYEVVKRSLDKGVETLHTEFILLKPEEARKKFRPWLQDFDIGAVYTAARIEAEIKAARDAGASGWLIWNARNVYEPARYVP
jgi:hypothetical protein